jgi:hypothetical protein
MHEAANAVVEFGEELGESLEETLRTRPLTTLAIAIGVGFMFGTAWRR